MHGKSPGKPEKKIKRSFNLFFFAGGALFIGLAVLGIYSRNAWTLEVKQLTDKGARTIVHVVHLTRNIEAISLQLPGQTMPYTDAPIFAQTSGYLQKWYFDMGLRSRPALFLPRSIPLRSMRSWRKRRLSSRWQKQRVIYRK